MSNRKFWKHVYNTENPQSMSITGQYLVDILFAVCIADMIESESKPGMEYAGHAVRAG